MTGIFWLGLGLLSSVMLPSYLLGFSSQLSDGKIVNYALPFMAFLFVVEVAFLYYGYAYHQNKPKRCIGWVAKTAADVIVVGGIVVVRVFLHDRYYMGRIVFLFLTTLLQVYWKLYWPTSDLSLLDVSLRWLMQVVICHVMSVMGINYKVLSMVVVLNGCVIFYRYWSYSPHVPVVTDNGGTVNISTNV